MKQSVLYPGSINWPKITVVILILLLGGICFSFLLVSYCNLVIQSYRPGSVASTTPWVLGIRPHGVSASAAGELGYGALLSTFLCAVLVFLILSYQVKRNSADARFSGLLRIFLVLCASGSGLLFLALAGHLVYTLAFRNSLVAGVIGNSLGVLFLGSLALGFLFATALCGVILVSALSSRISRPGTGQSRQS